jgi:CBS-domain-containing membrane protein
MSEPDEPHFFVDISDDDVYDAMAELSGFLDITLDDFKTLYLHASHHAVERLSRAITVRAAMQTETLWVSHDTPLIAVAERMTETGAVFMPVVGADGTVAGVITRADFLVCIAPDHDHESLRLVGEHHRNERGPSESEKILLAQDIMRRPAVTVSVDAVAKDVIDTVHHTGLTRFPVIDAQGRLVGVVALNDLLKQCFP